MLNVPLGTSGIKLGRDALFATLKRENLLMPPARAFHKTTNSFHRFYKHRCMGGNRLKDPGAYKPTLRRDLDRLPPPSGQPACRVRTYVRRSPARSPDRRQWWCAWYCPRWYGIDSRRWCPAPEHYPPSHVSVASGSVSTTHKYRSHVG